MSGVMSIAVMSVRVRGRWDEFGVMSIAVMSVAGVL